MSKSIARYTMPSQFIVGNREEVKAQILGLAAQDGVGTVITDWSAVEYCDTSGLGAMLTVERVLREQGKIIVLDAIPPDIAQLLHLTKFDERLFVRYGKGAFPDTGEGASEGGGRKGGPWLRLVE